jgi:hypothetical protein
VNGISEGTGMHFRGDFGWNREEQAILARQKVSDRDCENGTCNLLFGRENDGTGKNDWLQNVERAKHKRMGWRKWQKMALLLQGETTKSGPAKKGRNQKKVHKYSGLGWTWEEMVADDRRDE